MSDPSSRASDAAPNAELSLEERLVAYLDGELDPEDGRRIEELLASDPKVRAMLQQLDRTWDLLDELDQAPVNDDFTQTTLEMVTVAADEDIKRTQAALPRRRRRRWAFVGGGLLMAGLTGFVAVMLLRPDPNHRLVQDLPVLENLDEYRLIDDIEFLKMLDEEGLFAEEDGDEQ